MTSVFIIVSVFFWLMLGGILVNGMEWTGYKDYPKTKTPLPRWKRVAVAFGGPLGYVVILVLLVVEFFRWVFGPNEKEEEGE